MKIHSINNSNKQLLNDFIQAINQKKPVFVLYYMEGCGPCNATRPEWKKLATAVGLPSNISIFEIDRDLLPTIVKMGGPSGFAPALTNADGFPTMKYIKGAQSAENYDGGRTIDDFVGWIKSKTNSGTKMGGSTRRRRRHRHYRKSIRKTRRTRRQQRRLRLFG